MQEGRERLDSIARRLDAVAPQIGRAGRRGGGVGDVDSIDHLESIVGELERGRRLAPPLTSVAAPVQLIRAWITERTVVLPNGREGVGVLFADFCWWIERDGHAPITIKRFSETLETLGFFKTLHPHTRRRQMVGLRLK